jgi:hypothetical protein
VLHIPPMVAGQASPTRALLVLGLQAAIFGA